MAKPHEKRWVYDEEGGTVDDEDGIPVEFYEPTNGRLGAAAPDMARVLMDIIANDSGGYIPSADAIARARVALKKAGVLP